MEQYFCVSLSLCYWHVFTGTPLRNILHLVLSSVLGVGEVRIQQLCSVQMGITQIQTVMNNFLVHIFSWNAGVSDGSAPSSTCINGNISKICIRLVHLSQGFNCFRSRLQTKTIERELYKELTVIGLYGFTKL